VLYTVVIEGEDKSIHPAAGTGNIHPTPDGDKEPLWSCNGSS